MNIAEGVLFNRASFFYDKKKTKGIEVMESVTEIIKYLETICVSLGILAGGVAIVVKVIKNINDAHDRQQKYDGYDERIKVLDIKVEDVRSELIEKIEDAHGYAQMELKSIQESMDARLEEMQTNMDAKLQQISSELCMLSYCVGATLDGLKQQGCNGKVSEAKEKMDKHLNQQAHGELK